jgi:uncharacterized protein
MPISPERIEVLDTRLGELDVMMLSQLDGLLAGIIICPDPVPPSTWLPVVWTTEDGEPFVFEDSKQMEAMTALIMDYYNSLIEDLNAERYEALFEIDEESGDILWQLWAEGLMLAIGLAPPETWEKLIEHTDEEVAGAISMLLSLVAIAEGDSPLPPKDTDELVEMAGEVIPSCVEALYTQRKSQTPV